MRRLLWVKRIHILKVRSRCIQSPTVDDQVAIVADLNLFAPHRDQALNVKLILRQTFNALGFKYEDFATFRPAKVVRHPVYE